MRLSILKVLAYFDLFDYPVTADEILFFLDKEAPAIDLQTELDTLTREGLLFQLDTTQLNTPDAPEAAHTNPHANPQTNTPFYSLRNDPALTTRRLRGNRHADDLLKIAARISRQLYRFPYVRGIGISGSLSKHFADESADIDYFIITRRNRLWIARTLMHGFKKLNYLRNRQNWYCMNYYVDEEALEIKEKNIFTATEMITLLPASGNGGLVKFFDANNWTSRYFPQYNNRTKAAEGPVPSSIVKNFLEKILDGRWGDRLDDLFQRWTTQRWQKKEQRGDRNKKGNRMALQNEKHFSRPNPENFQQKVLDRYARRLHELEHSWGLIEASV
ncbi:MAG: hypothetical protein JST68_13825 [Bacteroidetes bacterium]|nr:hypothetical protein [Bacteroidota bacterium]